MPWLPKCTSLFTQVFYLEWSYSCREWQKPQVNGCYWQGQDHAKEPMALEEWQSLPQGTGYECWQCRKCPPDFSPFPAMFMLQTLWAEDCSLESLFLPRLAKPVLLIQLCTVNTNSLTSCMQQPCLLAQLYAIRLQFSVPLRTTNTPSVCGPVTS